MNNRIVSVQIKREEPDRNYRVLVMLQRADRPRHWRFNCPHCQTPLADLSGYEVRAITDFYNPMDLNNSAVGIRCTGKFCRYWYHFSVS